MKNLIYLSSLLCMIILIFSCTPCPDCPDTSVIAPDTIEDKKTLTVADTISPTRFNTWRANWASQGQNYISDTLTRYFTMPLVDITEFKDNKSSDVVAARFHLGMEDIGTNMIPHLMLVGVDANGDDVIDIAKGQYIYDVTKPCPNSCGKSSLPN